MDSNRFDDLTRTLAQGTSRRQALKALGGSLLAALVPHSALAKGGGNSTCAQFCTSVYPPGRERAKCISDAAKGECCITPNPASSYALTCYNIRQTCNAGQTTLSADCEDSFGDPIPTSIIVNTCSSSNYVITNCNAKLTCGSCNS
jgi:hypothetical protein